jgi:hypothetical protein
MEKRITYILLSAVILLLLFIFLKNDNISYLAREYTIQVNKHNAEYNKLLDSIDLVNSRYLELQNYNDSIFYILSEQESLLNIEIDKHIDNITNLENEKSSVSTWTFIELDSFWTRESQIREFQPVTPKNHNRH